MKQLLTHLTHLTLSEVSSALFLGFLTHLSISMKLLSNFLLSELSELTSSLYMKAFLISIRKKRCAALAETNSFNSLNSLNSFRRRLW